MLLRLNRVLETEPQYFTNLFEGEERDFSLALATSLIIRNNYGKSDLVSKDDFVQLVPYEFCNNEYVKLVQSKNNECARVCMMAYLDSGGRSVNFILANIAKPKNDFINVKVEKKHIIGISARDKLVNLLLKQEVLSKQ
ncbi:MAG: hypothetical protein JW791_02090 [Nanoarchaeota archaeon]|nr:hypothetical protein [Nanoarchaeota archaeon]